MSSTWISRPAVLWVLYEAPDVPAHLLSTLLVVAVYTGEDGKGAYISAATVAQLTRKSESQAERDLKALAKRKLIRRGNQKLVAHIRPDRRPIVYDLPISARNGSRGSTHDTPSGSRGSTDATPYSSRGSTDAAAGQHGCGSGVAPMLDKEALKRAGRGERGAVGATPPLASQENQLCACGSPLAEYSYSDEGKINYYTGCSKCECSPSDCAAGQTGCITDRGQVEDPEQLAATLGQLRKNLAEARSKGKYVVNSAFIERWSVMLGDGTAIVVGTADDMRTMATLLALDAELHDIALQSGHHGDHGDDPARHQDDEGQAG